MRFADELRDSVGERCTVSDLRTGTIEAGTIQGIEGGGLKVRVLYDSGALVRVGYNFVELTEDENA